jgi:hypothetical protein
MKNRLQAGVSAFAFAGATALTFGLTSPASAGNIVLTGHDNDYHCTAAGGAGTPNPCGVLGAEAKFVINGSSLPVLAIDQNGSGFGNELGLALSGQGITNVVKSAASLTAADFDPTKYSAFAVASVITCGGCDNPVGTGTLLAGFSSAITSFFNAGGGILGLSGATDSHAFDYVPESGGVISAITDFSGFVPTANGLADIPGFHAVNGDETHNTFSGFAPFYKVAETFHEGGPAVTIYGKGGTIGCVGTKCTISGGVPEPSTWALLGLGFFSLGLAVRRNKRPAQAAA